MWYFVFKLKRNAIAEKRIESFVLSSYKCFLWKIKWVVSFLYKTSLFKLFMVKSFSLVPFGENLMLSLKNTFWIILYSKFGSVLNFNFRNNIKRLFLEIKNIFSVWWKQFHSKISNSLKVLMYNSKFMFLNLNLRS